MRRDTVRARVICKGGEVSTAEVPIPVGSLAELSKAQEMESQVVQLARDGRSDQEIAEQLTRTGHRSPLRPIVLPSTVRTIRLRHRIMVTRHQSHPRRISGYLTVSQLSDKLGVSPHWIYDRIHNGTIQVARDKRTRLYLFSDRARTLERFRKLLAGKFQRLRF
jgi:hypothetical protein